MTNKQMNEMLAKVATGEMTLEQVQKNLNKKRGLNYSDEDITLVDEMDGSKAYFFQSGKLVSLPMNVTRNNGDKASLLPYYKTVGV